MTTIVNLTTEPATEEQAAAGVKTFGPANAGRIKRLLTFDGIPSDEELRQRADCLSIIALRAQEDDRSISGAMISPPGFFARYVEDALWSAGIQPLYTEAVISPHREKLPDNVG